MSVDSEEWTLAELILPHVNKLAKSVDDNIVVLISSGNYMGDSGARLLAKALQINSKLQYISYDRNNVTLQGYSDIAYALQW